MSLSIINIAWVTTGSTTSALKFKVLEMDAVVWNRAGVIRVFPKSVLTNLKNTIKQLKDRPNTKTLISPDVVKLQWSQGFPASKNMREALLSLTL